MTELVDELLQVVGWSLIDIVLGNVTKLALLPSSRGENGHPEPLKLTVIHHDPGNLIVISKPADLVINSNDGTRDSVEKRLKAQLPSLANSALFHNFYFVHRLDYATSGLLCIPLNKHRCAELSRLFERRQVQKYYLAIVRGHIQGPSELTIDIPVGEDIRYKTANNRMCTNHDWEHCLNARRAETRIVVLERGFFDTEFATKVLLKPVTGRRHQLRVHCLEIGHPIVGDFTYSTHPADRSQDSHICPPRMMLHAHRMTIPATKDSKALDLVAEDPFAAMEGVLWHKKEVVHDLEGGMERLQKL